jgi:beta-galactosidase
MKQLIFLGALAGSLFLGSCGKLPVRSRESFNDNWKFHSGDTAGVEKPDFSDIRWRELNLPHDWSIEGKFDRNNPATPGGGALPGGIAWYRKSFEMPSAAKGRKVYLDFDGVYRNAEVWINGHSLGLRPNGYISYRYDLTPYLLFDHKKNVLAVRVDNSKQPNSRWYSGSGIYRNVWLITVQKIYVDHWGTFITTPEISKNSASASIKIKIKNAFQQNQKINIRTSILDKNKNKVAQIESDAEVPRDSGSEIIQNLIIKNPLLWSVENPQMYTAVTEINYNGKLSDNYETLFGIRFFNFDSGKGFSLNGKPLKIKGVCNHHDLGFLGAAVNKRALERQLEIMKEMGVNGIRTSHNPPAPELLELCDKMGFIVMDEAYDMWKKKKTEYDYALNWDEWHVRDLEDMILRDRNHPSIFIWSIGNEVVEQWDKNDSSGSVIAKELASIIRNLDDTRPITANCNDQDPLNPVIKSGALDLIGYSYNHNGFIKFHEIYPGKKFIGSETTSALATRGHYDMPSDSIRRWPIRWDLPFTTGNPDNTCSSYDNCSAPWGSTHEETWEIIKKYDFLSGMYIWTGFDYLGEPTPYSWPSRSSYFGIVDLAGFPKDAFYMYQSEWTDKPVLHLFPHWNWKEGDTVDVWCYTNSEEVELFFQPESDQPSAENYKSLGTKKKTGDDLHLQWRVKFIPGTLKAVGYTGGKESLVQIIKTAGEPAQIKLEADRNVISADGKDLSFIIVKILDKNGTLAPDAENLVNFEISGEGKIAGVDNGSQTSHESFKANLPDGKAGFRKAFNGMCLVVVQSNDKPGKIVLKAKSERMIEQSIVIEAK